MKKPYFRINEKILSSQLRVVSDKGTLLGVMSKEEALKAAFEKKLDLVEIAPKAVPPVAKIVNFGKFLYSEEKRLKALAKKSKPSELKEIRFSPFIAANDYNSRIQRIKNFLSQKHKVRLVVVFKGRQLGSKQFGYNLLNKIVNQFGEAVNVDSSPKWLGRHLQMTISPILAKVAKLNNHEHAKG